MQQFSTLMHYSDYLDVAKDDLIKLWMPQDPVCTIFRNYKNTEGIFSHYFGTKIIDYAFDC